jgi:hypothetical protein
MQQSVEFEFQWWRDTKGYRLVDTPRPKPEEVAELRRSGPAAWPVHALVNFRLNQPGRDLSFPLHPLTFRDTLGYPILRIVRLGGDLVPYRPLDNLDDIFRAFINLPVIDDYEQMAEAVLDFVDRYGPLSREGLDETLGDLVGGAGGAIHVLCDMNQYINARLADDGASIRRLLGEGEVEATGIVPKLSYDLGTRSPKLRFHLPSLRTALCLHLMQSFDSGTAYRRCAWEKCGIVFEAGAGTGRRADSKFCCDQHRIAFNSVHRTSRIAAVKGQQRRRGRPRRATP